MLQHFFVAPKTLKRLRSGPSKPHVDSFAAELKDAEEAAQRTGKKALQVPVILYVPPVVV